MQPTIVLVHGASADVDQIERSIMRSLPISRMDAQCIG